MKLNMNNFIKIPLLFAICTILYSCSSSHTLVTSKVAYQSIRTVDYKSEVAEDAKIAAVYSITEYGDLVVAIANRTPEIMIIDQTMSFFVNTDSHSTSYYDPTIKVQSETDMTSASTGASVNLGAIGSAFGIGGAFGAALNGINVNNTGSIGTAITNTTYSADQQKISLAPKSTGLMTKNFKIKGVGKSSLANQNSNLIANDESTASLKFSVCISYSIDGGKTYDKMITNFYVNAQVVSPVTSGRVNDAMRNIFITKPDALYEPWNLLHIVNNITSNQSNIYDARVNGVLIDCK